MSKMSVRIASRWLKASNVEAKVQEIKEGTPPNHLPGLIKNIGKYLELRELHQNDTDEFIDRMEDPDTMEAFDIADKTFHDWKLVELEDLMYELRR